jgi:hypothetical protein
MLLAARRLDVSSPTRLGRWGNEYGVLFLWRVSLDCRKSVENAFLARPLFGISRNLQNHDLGCLTPPEPRSDDWRDQA